MSSSLFGNLGDPHSLKRLNYAAIKIIRIKEGGRDAHARTNLLYETRNAVNRGNNKFGCQVFWWRWLVDLFRSIMLMMQPFMLHLFHMTLCMFIRWHIGIKCSVVARKQLHIFVPPTRPAVDCCWVRYRINNL